MWALSLVLRLRRSESSPVPGAALVVAIFPILAVYPFLQRYFTAGVLRGASDVSSATFSACCQNVWRHHIDRLVDQVDLLGQVRPGKWRRGCVKVRFLCGRLEIRIATYLDQCRREYRCEVRGQTFWRHYWAEAEHRNFRLSRLRRGAVGLIPQVGQCRGEGRRSREGGVGLVARDDKQRLGLASLDERQSPRRREIGQIAIASQEPGGNGIQAGEPGDLGVRDAQCRKSGDALQRGSA